MKKTRGYVYLLSDTLNESVYKIGVTKSTIEKRIKQLQTGNPGEIHIRAYFETDYPYFIENRLHRRFFENEVHGEWYDIPLETVSRFDEICREEEMMAESLKDNPFVKLR